VGFLSLDSHIIIQSLEKGLKVRILLLAHNKEAYQDNLQFSKTLETEYDYSILQLDKIKQLTSGLKGTLEVRSYHNPLTISGLQSDVNRHDGTMLISLFTPTAISEVNLPYFVLYKKTSSELFTNFSRYLELAWEKSIPIHNDAQLPQND